MGHLGGTLNDTRRVEKWMISLSHVLVQPVTCICM